MKKILYYLIKVVNPILSHSLYSKLLFGVNCIKLKKPYYSLNIKDPNTFTEKICYIKFNIDNPLAPIVADKLAVREYIAEKIGREYLIPLLKTYQDPADIELSEIREDCILKTNNGTGSNYIVKKDDRINDIELIKYFEDAYKTDLFLINREWHYKKIKPRIIVEKLLTDNLTDYKFFCTSDGPFAVQVDIDRFSNHKRNIYDLDWNLLPYKLCYENSNSPIPKPNNFNKMVDIACALCKDFIFSRIDLYEYNNKVWFGEITLHPEGGAGPFDSKESDIAFGKNLDL